MTSKEETTYERMIPRHCERCNAYLNEQQGFNDYHYVWECTECGHKNSISFDDIHELEEDFKNPDN